ncbi:MULTISPECIES: 30S ribosome-binding factor RbfA [Candidatus Phytoplasma]|uniref:Ribosome-binding factor A n=2 Tax=Candidatus Phytoplasma TaxID=33926 RepID=A0ABP2TFQ1_PEWBP|nr:MULTISPECIES: 30S ribosome-binding factor RbfA [Phytoplasma]QLL37065.1 ribosome-binding factor A ['Echinacea purpurea' witches'-broom phytoplasma]WEX20610.1 MAG: ribosome-binding factor A [Candidatus Phytoplasma aurantifolia]WKV64318.1 MAG: ribosome-binding factor A [Candidatus Phytoplasma australasiaticum]EMR14518.1 ribosome-binding factor A [Peanut witches'-broom phytoplasma NTU2011]MDO8052440.1 30S ribosome-binding factor RbfA ['Vigna radiata' phytoplasma]
MSNLILERMSSIIHRELVSIVNKVIQNSQIGFISITDVKLTKDCSIAKIFYTIIEKKPEILNLAKNTLEKNKKIIRQDLADKIRKKIRYIPDLIFEYDYELLHGQRIEELLNKLNN